MPTPVSTYRVQIQPTFDFDHAADLADYLAALGVSHLYSSPYLQAAPGSPHGYDVVDHSRANDELGGERGRAALTAALRRHGLGQVLDVVPNHMCVAVPRLNSWWWDLLAHGSASRYAGYFDVDWDAPYAEPARRGRLVLPVLGDGRDETAALRIFEEDGQPLLAYHDKVFPVADGTADDGASAAEVAARQHYALTSWRLGNRALNYRRFFDITDLAAVRVEDDRVFAETHSSVRAWVDSGDLDGLRIDHPDGLFDPAGYLARLARAAPGAWIVVEKILEPGEGLDDRWPVAGTTGYDALHVVGSLFVDPAGEDPLTDAYREFTGTADDFPSLARRLKRETALTVLRAETSRLAVMLERIGVTGFWADAVEPLAELLASFPVYRTYLRPGLDADRSGLETVSAALSLARSERPADREFFDGVERVFATAFERPGAERAFVARLQQTTGMVMAKGVEDTTFYRYHRLVSLNEVGGDPAAFGTSLPEFHTANADRQRRWPLAMTTLSTHDTKRSEDVRARLAVLAEIPGEWADAVARWQGMAARHRRPAGPDANAEYLFWQSLVGAWPIGADRLAAYLEKATHEAKERTSWVDPDPAYDEAVRAFVTGVLDDPDLMRDVGSFAARVTGPGRVNSLAQKLVQLSMPGVPDVYQGSECWDLSLVDPDNRRPVDFSLRRALLLALDDDIVDLPRVADDSGAAKLLVTSRALRLRREHPDWFGAAGSYTPLYADGPSATHCVAFARAGAAVTVAPRLVVRLQQHGWRGTTLPLPKAARWRDLFTGRVDETDRLDLGQALEAFPVALLVAEP